MLNSLVGNNKLRIAISGAGAKSGIPDFQPSPEERLVLLEGGGQDLFDRRDHS